MRSQFIPNKIILMAVWGFLGGALFHTNLAAQTTEEQYELFTVLTRDNTAPKHSWMDSELQRASEEKGKGCHQCGAVPDDFPGPTACYTTTARFGMQDVQDTTKFRLFYDFDNPMSGPVHVKGKPLDFADSQLEQAKKYKVFLCLLGGRWLAGLPLESRLFFSWPDFRENINEPEGGWIKGRLDFSIELAGRQQTFASHYPAEQIAFVKKDTIIVYGHDRGLTIDLVGWEETLVPGQELVVQGIGGGDQEPVLLRTYSPFPEPNNPPKVYTWWTDPAMEQIKLLILQAPGGPVVKSYLLSLEEGRWTYSYQHLLPDSEASAIQDSADLGQSPPIPDGTTPFKPYNSVIRLENLNELALNNPFEVYGVHEGGRDQLREPKGTLLKYPSDKKIDLKNISIPYDSLEVVVHGDPRYGINGRISFPVVSSKARYDINAAEYFKHDIIIDASQLVEAFGGGAFRFIGLQEGGRDDISLMHQVRADGLLICSVRSPFIEIIQIGIEAPTDSPSVEIKLNPAEDQYSALIPDRTPTPTDVLSVSIGPYTQWRRVFGNSVLVRNRDNARFSLEQDGVFRVLDHQPTENYSLESPYYTLGLPELVPEEPIDVPNRTLTVIVDTDPTPIEDIAVKAVSADGQKILKLIEIPPAGGAIEIPKLPYSKLRLTYLLDGEEQFTPIESGIDEYTIALKPRYAFAEEDWKADQFWVEYYDKKSRNTQRVLKKQGGLEVDLPDDFDKQVGLSAFYDQGSRRKKIIIGGDAKLRIAEKALLVVLDLNHTNKYDNKKLTTEYRDFVQETMRLSQQAPILLYKFLTVIPEDPSYYSRYDIDTVYTEGYDQYRAVTLENEQRFWEYVHREQIMTSESEAWKRFYAFGPFTEFLPRQIKNTQYAEKAASPSYHGIFDLMAGKAQALGYAFDEWIYISYYQVEDPEQRYRDQFRFLSFNDRRAEIKERLEEANINIERR